MDKNKPTERKLKIQPKYVPRQISEIVIPEIRLCGKWLQDIGFTCGRFVTITQKENALIITMLPEAEVQPSVTKATRKKDTFIPPEISTLPGDQIFRVWAAEDYQAYVARIREAKKNKKAATRKSVKIVGFKSSFPSLSETLNQPAADSQIIQLHPEAGQADSCNFDTIA